MKDIILEVKNLKKYFQTSQGTLKAVDDISFSLERGKTLGIVGESGCGKSTAGRSILRLIEPTAGEVIFNGEDITKLSNERMRRLRKSMQIIFQDPFASLNPRMTISKIISEPIVINKLAKDKNEVNKKVRELMDVVGLAERLSNVYPHELDGGRRQRIGIARALAVDPELIICDEPVSALDVSIQAQILNLLKSIQKEFGLTYIFITHDLSVVNHFSDDIGVMYLGKFVEKASTETLFEKPVHPYTQALLSAIPKPSLNDKTERILLKGEITSPINLKDICSFSSRCIHAMDKCTAEGNPLNLIEYEPEHYVSCHLLNN